MDQPDAEEYLEEDSHSQRSWPRMLAVSIGCCLIYTVGCYVLFVSYEASTLLTLSFLLGMPIAAGILLQAIGDPQCKLSIWNMLGRSFLLLLAMIMFSIIIFKESAICLIMALPIFSLGLLFGVSITRLFLMRKNGHIYSMGFIILPFLLPQVEGALDAPTKVISHTSNVIIDAAPQDIWPALLSVGQINESELPRTFSTDILGIPRPLSATMEGQGVGAVRHARWNQAVAFDERITKWVENEQLIWDFAFSENSIPKRIEEHISPNSKELKIASGGYRLEPLANGKTRLILETHYEITTHYNGYAAWWGSIFMQDFHDNILTVVKTRIESGTI